MERKPLVVGDDGIEQLQTSEDLDIPLKDKFEQLNGQFSALVAFLAGEGFDLPDDVME